MIPFYNQFRIKNLRSITIMRLNIAYQHVRVKYSWKVIFLNIYRCASIVGIIPLSRFGLNSAINGAIGTVRDYSVKHLDFYFKT